MRSPRPPLRAPTASTNDHVLLPSDDAFPDGATANRRIARETSRVSSRSVRSGLPRAARMQIRERHGITVGSVTTVDLPHSRDRHRHNPVGMDALRGLSD
jgi:hypothetical protein